MRERLIIIGHVAEDTAEPENVIGGGVSYGGIAAVELGADVHIFTKLPPAHRFQDFLMKRGITIHLLPTNSGDMTTFTNTYDALGKRKQRLGGKQEMITKNDLDIVSDEQFLDASFLVAPVIGEVDIDIIPRLEHHGLVAVTPQGYFREAYDDGTIYHKEWAGFEKDLAAAQLAVFSEEDITIEGQMNHALLDKIRSAAATTVLTRGPAGAVIYPKDHESFAVKALQLSSEELVDFTGAGDTFATAYLIKFMRTGNHHAAAVFAAFYAGVKIAGLGGPGVLSVPSQEQLQQYTKQHPRQIDMFLEVNNARRNVLKI